MAVRIYAGKQFIPATVWVQSAPLLLTEDPLMPGYYLVTGLSPDPNNPGYYYSDGLVEVSDVPGLYEIPTGA